MGVGKSPFERHEIDHLSPSSLNTYADQPAFWCLKYLLGFKDEVDARAWRGNAVEAGLDHWLYKRDPEAAYLAAAERFEEDAVGLADDLTCKERDSLKPMLDRAFEALHGHGTPVGRQLKVEYWFDGIEVPVIGYVDYEWEDFGIDLKTTHRIPSVPWPRHARQVSLYTAAQKKPFSLLYASTKKTSLKDVEEPERELKRLEWWAHSIRRGLAMFEDPQDMARIFAPDFDHFYWGDAAKEAATQIWGDLNAAD